MCMSFFFCNFAVGMTKIQTYWAKVSSEEKANMWTHLLPLVATIGVSCPLLQLANSMTEVVGVSLFLLGMLLMFGSSTFYHAVTAPERKARLRVLDHMCIYLMIAGSYSLMCLSVVGGWLGWSVFVFLWVAVLIGCISKVVALGKYPKLSLALYLAMGWVALVIIVPLWRNMPHVAFGWALAEGFFYTIGSYFYSKDEEHAYYHAVWHVFIILGALSHTIATIFILKNI